MSVRLVTLCGAGAALATFAALATVSHRRGVPVARSLNATAHVVDGPEAASDPAVTVRRTGGGAAINAGAAAFWGGMAACAIASLRPAGPARRTLVAAATAAVAGIVDYGLVPKRLTPGWELALGGREVALVLAAMGAGIAAGALVDGCMEERDAKD